MPYKPPICPAYAQSQCLTLSPIPEARSRVNSPVISCKSSLFSGFEWAGTLSPLLSQSQPQSQQTCQQHATAAAAQSSHSFEDSITSPAILERLEQLNLRQLQQNIAATTEDMPGISSILARPTPTSDAINANLGLGLGLNFLTLPQTNNPTSTTTTIDDDNDKAANATPFNTPARPTAPKPIRTSFDPAAIELKLKALGEMPLTPPYDEDIINHEMPGPALEDNVAQLDAKEEEDEDTPLDVWLQYRIEEATRREEFEKESAEVLMSTSPLSISAQDLLITPAAATTDIIEDPSLSNSSGEYEDACGDLSSSSSIPPEEKDIDLLQAEQESGIVVTQGKRISVRDSCAIATLKRRSRLMGLHKEAVNGNVGHDVDGLMPNDHMQVDEFGMKIDGEDEDDNKVIPVGEAEVAMSEDRTSPKYSIFSPTSRLPRRRSVSFAKPEVTQVKTFTSPPLAAKSHKRKASASSLFTVSSGSVTAEDDILHITANGPRSVRSFSTGAIPSTPVSSNNSARTPRVILRPPAPNMDLLPPIRRKRARRSSSIVSSLAFTSNSLAPIFSSAFLKNSSTTDKETTGEVNVATLREAMAKSKKMDGEEDKENVDNAAVKGVDKRAEAALVKKRSFGISVSLSFRGKSQ